MPRHPFLLAASLLPMALACFVGLGASPAAACSPSPPERQYYTLQESHPADGATAVPLDGAVLLTSRAWTVTGDYSESWRPFESLLTVTVQDTETGESVSGVLRPWPAPPFGAVWRPSSPLSPLRRHALVATLNQTAARPAHAEGPTELRMTFTTGTQPSAPLELLGGLEVRLEEHEVDTYDCGPDSCGLCEKDGTESVPHARVRVPGLGGSALASYSVSIWVTDRSPFRFDAPPWMQGHAVSAGSSGVSSSGAPTETFFRMPQHEDAYRPCFSWQVTDPAGRTLEGPPVCLDEKVNTSGGFLGCSVGPGSASVTVGMLLLGGLAVRPRSRRQRGA